MDREKHPDRRVVELMDRAAILETVHRLFIHTDRKEWDALLGLFCERVRFDMTSLAGGTPAEVTARSIVDGWREALEPVAAVHHQVGNHLVTLSGDQAEVFCYGVATHYRPEAERRVTTFVGSYDLTLVRDEERWLVAAFRFQKKYIE